MSSKKGKRETERKGGRRRKEKRKEERKEDRRRQVHNNIAKFSLSGKRFLYNLYIVFNNLLGTSSILPAHFSLSQSLSTPGASVLQVGFRVETTLFYRNRIHILCHEGS